MPRRSNRSFRVSKDPKARREDILLAAEKEFEERGFISTNISRIMKLVGVSQPAFYHYFPNKQELFIKFARLQAKFLLKLMRKAVIDDKISPEEKIVKIFQVILVGRGARARFDRSEDGRPREDQVIHDRAVAPFLKPFSEVVALVIEQGVETGSFRVRDPKATALLLCAMTTEIAHRAATTEEMVEWDELKLSFWDAWTRLLGMSDEAAERWNPFAAENEK